MVRILISIICAAGIFAVAYLNYPSRPQLGTSVETPFIPQAIYSTSTDAITAQVQAMSLDEKIGQLLIVGFEKPYVDQHIFDMITMYHIGGINLLGRNVIGERQSKKLLADLQKISAVPLFLATDQEGGTVTRYKFLKEKIEQSQIWEPDQALRVAENRAKELSQLGVNMNFAPVLDYVSATTSYLYRRTFATTSEAIGTLGSIMVEGYRIGGVVPVAKHFPGYGNIKPDPHKNAAVVEVTKEEFDQFLVPFKVAIQQSRVGAIMTAHIIIPSIDSKPATISSKMLTDILRKDLGFEGVIITDDLEMASAGKNVEELAVESIKAGADMIISTYTPAKHITIFKRIKKAVETGEISEQRIDDSVARILRLKKTEALF